MTDIEYDMSLSDEELTEMAMQLSEGSLAEVWENDEDYGQVFWNITDSPFKNFIYHDQ